MRLLVALLPLQLGFHFWPEWSHIFGIRIDYLSPTIFATDLVIVFILLKNLRNLLNQKRIFVILLIGIFAIFNTLFGNTPEVSLVKWVKFLEFLLLGFYVFDNQKSIKQKIATPLSLALIGTFFVAVLQLINQSSLGGLFYWIGERSFNVTTPGIALFEIFGRQFLRPYGTFPHPNVLAGFSLVSVLLILEFKNKTKLHKTALSLGVLLVILSWSQAAWLAGVIVFMLYRNRNRLNTMSYKSFGIITVAFSLLLPILSVFITKDLPENIFFRQELSLAAGAMIASSPLIGVGLGGFIPSLSLRVWLQPVHNIFLLAASEIGLVGLIAFSALVIKSLNKNSLALIAILLTGFLDHYWITIQQTQILFVIVTGLSFVNINHGKEK